MDWLVVIKGGRAAVEAIVPDLGALGRFPARLVNVTSKGAADDIARGHDFVSRVFGPVPLPPQKKNIVYKIAPAFSYTEDIDGVHPLSFLGARHPTSISCEGGNALPLPLTLTSTLLWWRRCFNRPAVGVPEDPVTGSAHCGIAPYWSSVLGKEV